MWRSATRIGICRNVPWHVPTWKWRHVPTKWRSKPRSYRNNFIAHRWNSQTFLARNSNRFPVARLDEWVIMPDHIHGLIQLSNGLDLSPCRNMAQHVPTTGIHPLKPNSLSSSLINHFKGNVKRWCNQNGYGDFSWQPRFYDHIVRNDQDLIHIQEYIRQNPERWMRNNL